MGLAGNGETGLLQGLKMILYFPSLPRGVTRSPWVSTNTPQASTVSGPLGAFNL